MTSPPPGSRSTSPADAAGAVDRWIVAIGGTGMVASVCVDAAVVVARVFHHSLAGSTEVIQYGVVAASCAALAVATIGRSHAEVHLLTGRIAPAWRARIARAGQAALASPFLLLAVATAWLLADTIGEAERSDLLGLPILPLRVALLATCAGLSGVCWRRALARGGAAA